EGGGGGGPHGDARSSSTGGPGAGTPPIPGGCGAFPGGRDCRVAEFTTPSNAFATPSSFTLSASYGFECLSQFGTGCNGAAGWNSSLTGTATLHTASTTAAEPASLIVVVAGLLGARMLRRRRQPELAHRSWRCAGRRSRPATVALSHRTSPVTTKRPERTLRPSWCLTRPARVSYCGTVNVNVEPFPTWLLTQIVPPCSSMNFRDRASPSPVPSIFLSAVPTCRNSSNTAS